MTSPLKLTLGIGTLVLINLLSGFAAFALVGGVPMFLVVAMVAVLAFKYGIHSNSVTVTLSAVTAFFGATTGMVAAIEAEPQGFVVLVVILGMIVSLMGGICYIVLMVCLFAHEKNLYKDGTVERELTRLGEVWAAALPALGKLLTIVRDAYERQLPERSAPSAANGDDVAALRQALAEANARIDALEKARRSDLLQAMTDTDQACELHARVVDIEETLPKAQQARIAQRRAEREKNPLVKE
jgi:hypothetical protein